MATDLSRTRTAPDNRPRQLSRTRDPLRRARSSPEDGIHQLFSPQFMDDHGAHQYYANAVRDDLSEASTAPDDDDTSSSSESVEEVRFGIRNTRDSQDVEANRPELIREKSTRTIKDPNLVGYRAPDTRTEIDYSIRSLGKVQRIQKIPKIGPIKRNGRRP